ncbi:MAG: PfkB family carbohydrate kinase [archaeon]
MNVNKIVNEFPNKKILVIGDIILDRFLEGNVERVSPEAPIPVLNVKKETLIPGGAANVANNIVQMGGLAYLVSVVGDDDEKIKLLNVLNKNGINTGGIVTDYDRPTICKTRMVSGRQHLLRVDVEETHPLNQELTNQILFFIRNNIQNIDFIVVSDYNKGVVTQNLMEQLKQIANQNQKRIFVDPKPSNKEFYKGVHYVKPNYKEACELVDVNQTENKENHLEVGRKTSSELNSNVIMTLAEKGLTLFELGQEPRNLPCLPCEVKDVVGAGDTVAAAFALALSSNATLDEAAYIANHAAKIAVSQHSTSAVKLEELKNSLGL